MPQEKWFHDLVEEEADCVLLGNNKACKIMGICNINMKMADGCQRLIISVRYIPNLKRNLLSVVC